MKKSYGFWIFILAGFLVSVPVLAQAADSQNSTMTEEQKAKEKKEKMERLERQMNAARSADQVHKLNNIQTLPKIPNGVNAAPRTVGVSVPSAASVRVSKKS